MGQLNLSSVLAVASMVAGVALVRVVRVRRVCRGGRGAEQDDAYRNLVGGEPTPKS